MAMPSQGQILFCIPASADLSTIIRPYELGARELGADELRKEN